MRNRPDGIIVGGADGNEPWFHSPLDDARCARVGGEPGIGGGELGEPERGIGGGELDEPARCGGGDGGRVRGGGGGDGGRVRAMIGGDGLDSAAICGGDGGGFAAVGGGVRRGGGAGAANAGDVVRGGGSSASIGGGCAAIGGGVTRAIGGGVTRAVGDVIGFVPVTGVASGAGRGTVGGIFIVVAGDGTRGAVIDLVRGAFAGEGTTGRARFGSDIVCDPRGLGIGGAGGSACAGSGTTGRLGAGSEPGAIKRSRAKSRSESSGGIPSPPEDFGWATRGLHCRSRLARSAM